MKKQSYFWPGVMRLTILFLISAAFVGLISESAHRMLKDPNDRGPKVIELIIPEGTADRIAKGMSVPSIPAEMIFVVGDTLVIKNNDLSDHQLGPVWVPAGKSAVMAMEEPATIAYSCSFQTRKFLGLDVRQATTLTTRLTGIMLAAPATTVFLFVYSILVWPLTPKEKKADDQATN